MSAHKTILIVDDDPDDRFLFKRAVKNLDRGYDCVGEDDAEVALQHLMAAEQLPDFIFLDLNMPRMDGFTCLSRLKSTDRLRNIPVIIYSTSAADKDISDTRKLGASHYLVKPSHVDDLPAQIWQAICTVAA